MHPGPDPIKVDVAVIGGGPAGLTAGVALAAAGVSTILVAPPHAADNRTTALLAGSVAELARLGAWRHCEAHAAPLRSIRIVDDRGGLLRAPEVLFQAHEVGLDAFGYNIESSRLIAALTTCAMEMAALQILPVEAAEVAVRAHAARVTLENGRRVEARLVVGADGRNSVCRGAAAIRQQEWRYPQAALTCNVQHAREHHDISTEFHTATGPFTLVPLGGRRSSLVWVSEPDEAQRLRALDDAALSLAIERRAHSFLGKMSIEPGRGLFPLAYMSADPYAANRVALVGEAAHIIPPIGAQGFNLGLRDAVAIADQAAMALAHREDPGSDAVLNRYCRDRRSDAGTRTVAVDLLNRSLLTDLLPLQVARTLGLSVLRGIGPLRRALMRAGVGPNIPADQGSSSSTALSAPSGVRPGT